MTETRQCLVSAMTNTEKVPPMAGPFFVSLIFSIFEVPDLIINHLICKK
jgi:hypothetical protein